MKIVVLNEGSSDSRVSASPETVKKISEMNHEVYVQKGAGLKSLITKKMELLFLKIQR